MDLLTKKTTDKPVLKLVRKYLTTAIMEDGVESQRTAGTPQGSPLSPLLSNILLHELDKELHARGLRFVRCGDDCSIYVKSRKSAERVMASITKFIEADLNLKVNKNKSKISKPSQRTLLGFSFYKTSCNWIIRIAGKSVFRIKEKIKQHLNRSNPSTLSTKLKGLRAIIIGWMNYFMIAQSKTILQRLDEQTRTRARIGQWHQWKRVRTRIKALKRLGIKSARKPTNGAIPAGVLVELHIAHYLQQH